MWRRVVLKIFTFRKNPQTPSSGSNSMSSKQPARSKTSCSSVEDVEAISSSEMSMNLYQTTRRHSLEDRILPVTAVQTAYKLHKRRRLEEHKNRPDVNRLFSSPCTAFNTRWLYDSRVFMFLFWCVKWAGKIHPLSFKNPSALWTRLWHTLCRQHYGRISRRHMNTGSMLKIQSCKLIMVT